MSIKNTQQYLLSDPGEARTVKIIRALFLAGVMLFAVWLAYFAFQTMTLPYQIEYREGAAQVMTQILLRGENPFSPENQPAGFTSYGAGYSLFVLPFAALFGNTLLVHRAATFVFLALGSLLAARSLFQLNHNLMLSAACGLLVAIALAGRGGLGASANAMGALLFLAGVLIPFNRSFDERSLMASALLSLIAFYTKPYFVLAFAIAASYVFLFVSKKRALRSAIFFALIFVLAFVLVRWSSKYYFVDTIASNVYNPGKSPSHVVNQLAVLIREFYSGALIAVVLLALAAGKSGRAAGSRGSADPSRLEYSPGLGDASTRLRQSARRPTPTRFNIRSLEAPVVSRGVDYFAWAFVISLLAFSLLLGQNRGNYMTYSYQLLVPTFFLWLFKALDSRPRLTLVSLPLLLLNAITLSLILLNPAFLRQRESPEWAQLHWYVSHSQQILNSPVIAAEMVELGMQPFDSGHTEFYYVVHPYPSSILLGPSYDAVLANGQIYMKAQHDRISKQEYDRLILTKEYKLLVPHSLVGRKYVMVTEIRIEMPQAYQWLTVEIWEPAPD